MNKYTEEHFWMRRAMSQFGGSFIKALSECFERADNENYAKLESTFPEYVTEYIKGGKYLSKLDAEEIKESGGSR